MHGPRARDNRPMVEISNMDMDALAAEAAEWRRRALRGDAQARGMAHELERTLRRHLPTMPVAGLELDTRPLELRRPPPRWWKLW